MSKHEHPHPAVVSQGKAVIQPSGKGDLFVMMPDGTVEVVAGDNGTARKEAERRARAWFQKRLGRGAKIGLGLIEWRMR